MSSRSASRMRLGGAILIFGVAFLASSPAWGDESPVIRIEQDWEMTVGEPDPQTNAPQIICVISPTAGVNSLYAVLELNHQSLPSYAPGGLQLQLWNGEEPRQEVNARNGYLIETAGETVRWTQCMEIRDGNLFFSVKNGTSTTWGEFGGEAMTVSAATTLADLSGYSTATSAELSGVGFAPHRVQALKIVRVRWYKANGQAGADAVARLVHSQN